MKTTLISIGNSRGIRIPKPFIEECGLENGVEIVVQNKTIQIHATRKIREGWENSFKSISKHSDDTLLDQFQSTQWDHEEWEWK